MAPKRPARYDTADDYLAETSREVREQRSLLRDLLNPAGVNGILWRIVEGRLGALLDAGGGSVTVSSPSGRLQAVVTVAASGTLSVKLQRPP